MSAIGWTVVENAIAAWALAGSGLASGKVIWSYPGVPVVDIARPTPPYLELKFAAIRRMGQDWTDREIVDPESEDFVPGKEIRLLHRGPRIATLSLQLFADAANGETGALARLDETLSAIDIHVDALDAAGIGIGTIGDAQLVAGRVNTLLEPRAVAQVEIHLFSELESYIGYVERITGSVVADPASAISFEFVIDPPEEA